VDLDSGVGDEVAKAADSFFASRSRIRTNEPAVAAAEAVATVRLAGALGLLAADVGEQFGGGGGEPAYAGLIAEAAGRHLVHPLVLHQLGCVAYLSATTGSESLCKEFALGTKTGMLVWHKARATTASVPGAVVAADYALFHTQHEGLDAVPAANFTIEMSTEIWRSPLEAHATITIPTATGRCVDAESADHALAVTGALVALYSVGAARQLVTDTVEYALSRRQFGAPIGSFQAIKHALANADIAIGHARALAIGSLAASRDGGHDAEQDLGLAKVAAHKATTAAAETCLQVYGGLGFTWESDVHIYLKMFTALGQWPMPSAVLSASLWHGLCAAQRTTLGD
jgi:alkylation response protein AidB-like acyl-CoA dehydrogenase